MGSSPKTDLESSFRHCESVTRARAKNFYYGIKLLPPERRRALCAIYAFFRYCDDVSDGDLPEAAEGSAGEASRRAQLLRQWRQAIAPESGQAQSSAILPAYYDSIARYQVPLRYFHEMIDGVEADLVKTRYETFEELYSYCYQVASTVGLVCIHVFGFDGSQEALQQAEHRGIAFQLTNILRDVSEDVGLGRIYLPLEDLRRFGVTPEALLRKQPEAGFADLMRFEVDRARDYYARSAGLPAHVEPQSRSSLQAMTSIYRKLLEKVAHLGPKALQQRVKLSLSEKLKLAGETLVRQASTRR